MNVKGVRASAHLTSSLMTMLILLAFTVKSIIPAGFMPGVSKDGYSAIVICSGMGEKTILVPNDDTTPSEHKEHKADLCAYQAASNQKILIDAPAVDFTALVVIAIAQAPFTDVFVTAHKTLSHSPRAPPLFV